MSDPLLERSRAFVAEHGAPLERLRAERLAGRGDTEPVRRALEALQAPDGSFPALPGPAAADVAETTRLGLECFAELRVRQASALERAVGFLARRQADDGSFGPPEGDVASRMAATGRAGAALARTPYARPALLASAGDWLAAHWSPGLVAGSWSALAGAAAFFANAEHDVRDEALQWCGRELERGFRSGRFSAGATARVLVLCDAVSLPGAALDPGELVFRLRGEQGEDGGFGAQGASIAARVDVTLDAMRSLVSLPG